MHKTLILLLMLALGTKVHGQVIHGLELGVNAMNASLIIDNENIDTNNAWGPRVGYVGELFLLDQLYLGFGGIYMQKGFKYIEETWELNSFDVPINMGYLFNLNSNKLQLFVDAGVSFEYNFRAITKNGDTTVELIIGDGEGEIKTFNSGFTFGTGLRLSQLIKFRINYYSGFSNLLNTGNGDSWKNHYLGFSLRFFFKKSNT